MSRYIHKNIMGVFAIEDGKVTAFEPFSKEPEEIAKKLAGTCEEEEYVIKSTGFVETEGVLQTPGLEMLLDAAGATKDDYTTLLREVSLHLAKEKTSTIPRDMMIIQAVEAQDDAEEALNILSERIREWYSLHFPELDRLVTDHSEYAGLIKEHISKENFPDEFSGESSMGTSIAGVDAEILRQYAAEISRLYGFKDTLNSYIESAMEDIAPNLSAFAGPIVGAKLMAQARGLENLAKMPASRIQVLGAQRAMFKHMKKRAQPPKHGVIFQHPSIKTAPWWQRGKIARSFSGKASIAAKADAFGGEFIADELKSGFKRRLKEIKEQNPTEPKKMRIIRRPDEKKRRKGRRR